MFRRLVKVIALFLPLCLHSEVFMRIPRNAGKVLSTLGGSQAYQSEVEINGLPGLMSTFIFSETSDIIAARLARTLKLQQPKSASVIILDASGRALTRYFVFQAPNLANKTMVMALEQSSSAFKDKQDAPPPWPDNVPVLNATPTFTSVCKKTNSTFLSAVSHSATPEAAVNEAVIAYSGAGWNLAVPSTPNFKIMVQDRKQCAVFATTDAKSMDVTINILQREGATQ